MSVTNANPCLFRGIPVSDILARCSELSKTFATPTDLGSFLLVIDKLPSNPMWQQISLIAGRQPWQISGLEAVLFDATFRTVMMELVAIWLSNNKDSWNLILMESPAPSATTNPLGHTILPALTSVTQSTATPSVKPHDSSYMSLNKASTYSVITPSASSSLLAPINLPQTFYQVVAILQPQIDGKPCSGGSNTSISSVGSSSMVNTPSRKRPATNSQSVAPIAVDVVPSFSVSPSNTSVTSVGSSSSPLTVSHVVPTVQYYVQNLKTMVPTKKSRSTSDVNAVTTDPTSFSSASISTTPKNVPSIATDSVPADNSHPTGSATVKPLKRPPTTGSSTTNSIDRILEIIKEQANTK